MGEIVGAVRTRSLSCLGARQESLGARQERDYLHIGAIHGGIFTESLPTQPIGFEQNMSFNKLTLTLQYSTKYEQSTSFKSFNTHTLLFSCQGLLLGLYPETASLSCQGLLLGLYPETASLSASQGGRKMSKPTPLSISVNVAATEQFEIEYGKNTTCAALQPLQDKVVESFGEQTVHC